MKEGMFTMNDLEDLRSVINAIKTYDESKGFGILARFQIRTFRAGVREGMRKAKWQTVVGFPQTLLPGREKKK